MGLEDMDPDECRRMADILNGLDVLSDHLASEREQLEWVAYEDPVGAVLFGDDDAWWDKRLGRNAPQE